MEKLKSLFISLFVLLTFNSCDYISDFVDPEPTFDVTEDAGNLVINNYSDHALVLYHNGEPYKKIPNSATDFIIWLPNDNDMTFDLQLYKYDDVAPNFPANPDLTKVYKRWNINLSDSKDIEKRATWHITNNEAEINSGNLKFSYVGGTDYQVDVFLNNQNGAKIITLKPGDQYDKIVGIDYGAYTLHFRYWISDPNTPEGLQIKGWVEKEVVAGQEVDIWAVINSNRPEKHLFIPHYDQVNAVPDRRGSIKIINQYPEPIAIRANGRDIEELMYLDGDTQAASMLAYGDAIEFVLDENIYTLEATSITAGGTLATAVIDLSVGENAEWTIKVVDGTVVSEVVDPEPVVEEEEEETPPAESETTN
ncbi:hypothetical protein [Algivirga pacifica]|uniref:Uncharacterized protein n=1 Tax=Algivirga pacifica TaxID=1162670 RepID=A0ABP9DCU8_9BACT